MHDKLLTNAVRYTRHMAFHSNCDICGTETEDIDHTLRRCPQALGVWQLCNTETSSLCNRSCGSKNGSHLTPLDPHWQTKFLTTTWYIWKWRFKASFGAMEEDPVGRGRFLEARFHEIIQALDSTTALFRAQDHNQGQLN